MYNMLKRKVFITGGAGYIGSHACVEFLERGFDVAIFDNFSNSSQEVINRIEHLADSRLTLFKGDICDFKALSQAMQEYLPDSVIHFAGLKSVNESMTDPLSYYFVNVGGSLNVLKSMLTVGCKEIIFSSSASVYGDSGEPPFTEQSATNPVSNYANTKLTFEKILEDCAESGMIKAVILRYFNPVGAHPSGLIGENPRASATNLMPVIIKAALNQNNYVEIFGNDLDTIDGTGERDYIHVADLAVGHLRALEKIESLKFFQILNLGVGKSTSVKQLIGHFENFNQVRIKTKMSARRQGDVAKSFADPSVAEQLLGFHCVKSMEDICKDTWNWVQKNPRGYVGEGD